VASWRTSQLSPYLRSTKLSATGWRSWHTGGSQVTVRAPSHSKSEGQGAKWLGRPPEKGLPIGDEREKRFARAGQLGGRNFWISGKSGQGETTLARLIASELAEPWNVEEMDAAEVIAAKINAVRQAWHRCCSFVS
jgi:hypothetical protein